MRPLYSDPSTDAERCDALSDPTREQPRQLLCHDCKGDGTKFEHIAGGYLEKMTCLECGGKGYYEEEL